jgi:hypothetical protein
MSQHSLPQVGVFRRIVGVESFIRLTAAQRRQLEAEAVCIGAFFDAEVALSVGALG